MCQKVQRVFFGAENADVQSYGETIRLTCHVVIRSVQNISWTKIVEIWNQLRFRDFSILELNILEVFSTIVWDGGLLLNWPSDDNRPSKLGVEHLMLK